MMPQVDNEGPKNDFCWISLGRSSEVGYGQLVSCSSKRHFTIPSYKKKGCRHNR